VFLCIEKTSFLLSEFRQKNAGGNHAGGSIVVPFVRPFVPFVVSVCSNGSNGSNNSIQESEFYTTMPQSEKWFQAIFNEAAGHKEATHEYGKLQVMIRKSIRGGESDQKYIRNQFGYESELPSSKKDTTRAKLFNDVYTAVLTEIRKETAYTAAKKVWGVALAGLTGFSSYLTAYAGMCERNMDEAKISIAKGDVKLFQEDGVTVTKKDSIYSGTVTRAQLLKRLSGKLGIDATAKHEAFAAKYVEMLKKQHVPVREGRMSTVYGVDDDFDYDSL
jgi:hypothetical protein